MWHGVVAHLVEHMCKGLGFNPHPLRVAITPFLSPPEFLSVLFNKKKAEKKKRRRKRRRREEERGKKNGHEE